MKALLLFGILIADSYFLTVLIKDLIKNKSELKLNVAKAPIVSVYSFLLFFASTFGIPDFAVSTAVYQRFKWVEDKRLPGTLIVEGVLPVTVMAIGYLSFVNMDSWTLICPIIAQLIGCFIGPRIAFRLPVKGIKRLVAMGLLIAAVMLLCTKLGMLNSSGTLVRLTGWRMGVCLLISFACGILNSIGVGSFSVMLALLYALGLNSVVAYPIMMCAAALSVPIGGSQFVHAGAYDRKIAVFANIFGVLGAAFAVFVVKNMDLTILQWIIMVILFYSAFTTFKKS